MVNKRVNAVLELKDPTANVDEVMARLATFANDNFGKGGDAEATQIEGYLGFVNTPVFGVYFTIEIEVVFGQAIEMIQETADARLVRVEWPFVENGEPIVYPEITYTVEVTDPETGEVTFRQQPIGRKSST